MRQLERIVTIDRHGIDVPRAVVEIVAIGAPGGTDTAELEGAFD